MTTEDVAMQLPTSFYVIVGSFILANAGAIITFFWGGLKMYGESIKWKTTIEMTIAKHEKDINNAFKEIRKIKDSE